MASSWASDRGGVVYGLFDPRDGRLRYVGKAQADLGARFRSHLHKARKKPKEHRDWWIRQVLEDGKKPQIQVLEKHDSAAALSSAEQRIIAERRIAGDDLTNKTDGGEGAAGYRHTAETRVRMSQAATGRKRPTPWLRRLTDDQETELVRRYVAGESTADVGAFFGLSPGGARKIVMRHGVILRVAVVGRWLSERRKATGC